MDEEVRFRSGEAVGLQDAVVVVAADGPRHGPPPQEAFEHVAAIAIAAEQDFADVGLRTKIHDHDGYIWMLPSVFRSRSEAEKRLSNAALVVPEGVSHPRVHAVPKGG